jgi:ATP dependent DNA ligase domain
VLVYQIRDLTRLPLRERRELLFSALKLRSNRGFASEFFEVSAQIMLQSAKEQGLEGIIGKRRDSAYEPGKRSGAWIKHRLNLGQELVWGALRVLTAWIRLSWATTGAKIWSMSLGREMTSFRPPGGACLIN